MNLYVITPAKMFVPLYFSMKPIHHLVCLLTKNSNNFLIAQRAHTTCLLTINYVEKTTGVYLEVF